MSKEASKTCNEKRRGEKNQLKKKNMNKTAKNKVVVGKINGDIRLLKPND